MYHSISEFPGSRNNALLYKSLIYSLFESSGMFISGSGSSIGAVGSSVSMKGSGVLLFPPVVYVGTYAGSSAESDFDEFDVVNVCVPGLLLPLFQTCHTYLFSATVTVAFIFLSTCNPPPWLI